MISFEQIDKMTKRWARLAPEQKEVCLGVLLSELVPDQKRQAITLWRNHGIDVGFNYAINTLSARKESARTPAPRINRKGTNRKTDGTHP